MTNKLTTLFLQEKEVSFSQGGVSYTVAYQEHVLFVTQHKRKKDAPKVGELRVIAGVLCTAADIIEWYTGASWLFCTARYTHYSLWCPVDADTFEKVRDYKRKFLADFLQREFFIKFE